MMYLFFYVFAIYLIIGLLWYGREDEARQAVASTCKGHPVVAWIVTLFLILIWPWWLYRRISLYIHYCKLMSRKR